MEKRSLQFAELTMAVIVGVLLNETASIILADFSLTNTRLIVLVLAMLIFLEMYIVLVRYHQQIGVPYAPAYLFLDLFICLIFIIFVLLIRDSRLSTAMLVVTGLFIILAARQILTFRQTRALDASLEKLGILKKDLILPIFADFVSIPVCLAIYLASNNNNSFIGVSTAVWAWIGILLFVAYFLLVYVFKFELELKKRL